jgi:PAS domain S-box-containing protein
VRPSLAALFARLFPGRRDAEALRDQLKLTRDLLDAVPVAMAMRDTGGRYLFVNSTWEKYFGAKREQVVGTRIQERLPGGEAERALALDREALGRGPGSSFKVEDFERGGRLYSQTRTVVTDPRGGVLGVVIASHDTTERNAMEHALRRERERLDLLVHSTKAGFSDWNAAIDTVVYSERFKEMLGHPPRADTSDWPGIFDMMHPDDREPMRGKLRAMLRRRKRPGLQPPGEPLQFRLQQAGGGYIWVRAESIVQVDDTGRVRRLITSFQDITRFREQEEALRANVRLREDVERMSRHDLKTPLSTVIAMSRLLRENSTQAPEDAELIDTIERAGYRILNMVNLSLDMFRMENGTYQFNPQPVDVAEVVRKVAADLESQAASKNIDVRVRANNASAASNPMMAQADELLCYSMFANLVKNAIEAAPEGGAVTVLLTKEGDAVVVDIHNRGAVPEALRGRFFQKYATAGKTAGLGLGAYSAHLMARVQHGELKLRSSEAEGTTLTARLNAAEGLQARAPADGATKAEALALARGALPALHVLVVDDDEFNRLVLRRYLPTPPLTIAIAVNGRAALEAAERQWPDVVLLDLEMPVMDGYTAAVKLREAERAGERKRCKIVAISSNDDPAIMERALAAGCDDYLVKPAPRETLWRLLAGMPFEDAPRVEAAHSDPVLVDAELRDSLPAFLESRRQALDEMPLALTAGDRARFKRLAHRLAGSLPLYGLLWGSEQCYRLEAEALAGDAVELRARAVAVRAWLDAVAIEFRVPAGR